VSLYVFRAPLNGQTIGIGIDFIAIALAELGSISERRTYQLIWIA
jgi:histidine ammonia-lyase